METQRIERGGRESRPLDRYQLEWLLYALVALVLGGYTGWTLYDEYSRIDASERSRLRTQSEVVAKNLGRQLLAVDNSLESIRDDLPALDTHAAGNALIDRHLKAVVAAMPGVRTIVVMNADGMSVASNRAEAIGLDVSKGERYQLAKKGGDPGTLYVSSPFKTVLGVYALGVSKLLIDGRGQFAGVIVATLDPDYFSTLLDSVRYAQDMRSSLIHGDGKVAFRVPDTEGMTGIDLGKPDTPFFRHMQSGEETSLFTTVSATTGELRLIAFRTIRPAVPAMDKPLVFSVSREIATLYAPWRKSAFAQGALLGLFLLSTAVSLLFSQRRQRAAERSTASQEEERSLREAELRQAQDRLALAESAAHSGVWDWDMATGTLVWSKELFRLFGLDPTAAKASFETWSATLHPLDAQASERRIDDAIRTHSRLFSEYRIVRPSGEIRWIAAHGDTTYDAQGQALRMSGICIDVTERKRAELLLQTRLRLTKIAETGALGEVLQAALDGAEQATNSSIGFFHFVDPDQEQLTLQAWSTNTLAHMCKSEGKDQHYAISAAGVWVDAFHARAPVIHNDYASLPHKKGMPEGHATVTRELVVPVIRAGKVTEILGVGNKPTDYAETDVETVVAIAGMVQEVIERMRAEATLRESEARLAAVFQGSPIGIVVSKLADGTVVQVNEATLRELGYTNDEMIGQTSMSLGIFVDPTQRELLLQQLLEKGRVEAQQIDFRKKSGECGVIELSARLIELRGEKHLLAMMLDVTARKRLEAMHLQSQKLQALGTLAGGVAHDFNNALAAILGNVELARQDVGPDHAALVSLDEIAKASRRSKDLVQQILAFGRRQKLERKPMSLALVVVETARLVRATLPAMIDLNVNCEADTPAVLADATQIEQILLNLCSNAAHAVEDIGRPGVIEVNLSSYELTKDQAQGVLPLGRYACLMVRDNGFGMDEATRSHIFEPFFTTKQAGKGTGLGLSVVHGIVQAHGASIEVESTPGSGSTFRIYFPAIEAPALSEAAPTPETAPVQGKGKHVLYLDDEEAIIFLMKRLLERKGYRVSGYTDPRKALAAVRADPGQFDLAVTDYYMPGMSGLEVAQELRRIRPDLPVVMASGYISEELRARAPAVGVRELIYKPNTVEDLCEAIARCAEAPGEISS